MKAEMKRGQGDTPLVFQWRKMTSCAKSHPMPRSCERGSRSCERGREGAELRKNLK